MTRADLLVFQPTLAPSDANKLAQANLVQMHFLPPELGGDGDFGFGSKMALAGLRAACSGDVLDVAQSQIGAQELADHGNDGPIVNLYLSQCGLRGRRLPWCATKVSWDLARWNENTAKPLPFAPPNTAGAWSFEEYDGSHGMRCIRRANLKLSDLRRGDIVMYTFSHVGWVLSVSPNGTIYTVEGNTNEDGSRDGYECIKHVRHFGQVRSILRLPFPS